jgi:hypothetical protein
MKLKKGNFEEKNALPLLMAATERIGKINIMVKEIYQSLEI